MVYILPLSSYKNNEQLINKSCPELFFCPEKKLRESADFPRRFPELFSVVQYSVFIKDHSPMISYRDFCLKLRLDQSVSITFTFVNYVHLLCLSIEEYKEIITTLAAYQEIAQKIEKELASKQKSSVPLTFSANASAQNLKRVNALAYKTNYARTSNFYCYADYTLYADNSIGNVNRSSLDIGCTGISSKDGTEAFFDPVSVETNLYDGGKNLIIRASGEILYYIAPSRYGILARGTVVYFSYTGSHGDYVN